jgi:hypothetical protein
MGPETPLTRIREIMVRNVSLYQLAKRPNRPRINLEGAGTDETQKEK